MRRFIKYGRPGFVGRMLLQWHVTERCNLRCDHCYQGDSSGQELEFSRLLEVIEQFRELVHSRGRQLSAPALGRITLTGGEPFVRSDFEDLLERVAVERSWTSFAILTNGSLIDTSRARWLAKLRPAFVQVSIDGSEATHDRIRGRGNFHRTVEAVKCLVRERIRTLISFTAHRGNYREFADVARLGCKLRVARVWADRIIPCGHGTALATLSPEETREFFGIMRSARDRACRRLFCRTEVAMHRALQFLEGGCGPYHCTAGNTLLTVMPDGDVVPCRRMPIRVGNVMETPLAELYEKNEFLRALRDPERLSQGCEGCGYRQQCRGGLRCLAYALTNDPFKADPGCWRAHEDRIGSGRTKRSGER